MESTRHTLHKEGLRPAFEEMRPRELNRRSKSSSRSTSRCDVLVTIDHILVFLKHFSVSTVLSRCVDADGDRYCRLLRCDRSPRGFVNVIRSGGGSNLQKVHASFKVASAAVEDRRKNASAHVYYPRVNEDSQNATLPRLYEEKEARLSVGGFCVPVNAMSAVRSMAEDARVARLRAALRVKNDLRRRFVASA